MKIKIIFFLMAVFIVHLSANDSIKKYYPNWTKGEKKNVSMKFIQKSYLGMVSISYEFEFILEDVKSDTLFIVLNTKNVSIPSQQDYNVPIDESMIEALKNLKYRFKTNSRFTFFDLLNFEEIYTKIDKISQETLKKQGITFDNSDDNRKTNKELLKGKIFQDSYKVIAPLFYPYNLNYPFEDSLSVVHCEFINSDTIYYNQNVYSLEENDDSITYKVEIKIDPSNWDKLVSVLNNEEYNPIDINKLNSTYTICFNKIDGQAFYIKREVSIGEQMEINEYQIK